MAIKAALSEGGKRLRPVWLFAKRVATEITDDRIGLTAAGVAFYAFLSIFPGLAALVSIWGLVADPAEVIDQLNAVDAILPGDVAAAMRAQAQEVAQADERAVGVALVVGLAVTLFSASRAVKAIMQALNIVYDTEETRGFVKFNAQAYAITLAVIVGGVTAIGALAVLPIALEFLRLDGVLEPALWIIRWPILFFGAWIGVAALYKFAPAHQANWRWLKPGAGAAVVLWVVASIVFSVYVQNFANYNETYGSIGAVVVLLMWFWVSAFVFLVGAELDSELDAGGAKARRAAALEARRSESGASGVNI